MLYFLEIETTAVIADLNDDTGRSLAGLDTNGAGTRLARLFALLRGFGADAWTRRGTASGKVMSVRALAFVIAGHEVHHVGVLRERYGVA